MQNLHDVRDRTAEFFSTVASFQKPLTASSLHQSSASLASSSSSSSQQPNRLFTNPTLPRSSSAQFPSHSSSNSSSSLDDTKESSPLLPHPSSSSSSSSPPQSQFNVAASDISRSLGALSDKLERLGRLVQKKSLFDDPTREIEELTHYVKVDLEAIEQALSALDAFVRREGGKGGKEDALGGQSVHGQSHAKAVVDNLRALLKKQTGAFMEVLQTRTRNMKEQNTRRKLFENNATPTPLRQRGGQRYDGLSEASLPSISSSSASVDLEPHTADDPVASSSSQLQAFEEPSTTDAYLTSRATAVESIESTIHELGSMYTRLTALVSQQEEVILRIDSNLDETAVNMERGHQELLKYFDGISGNRMLILKVFAILIAFLVFFMIFVA